tara:strand:- start:106 stop:822 length:717 start_codon:yes stop_codon:yes gene_type:complete
MRNFGLIGKNLSHSFSKKYFERKFIKEKIINSKYENFEINNIYLLKDLIKKNNISGLNVTIPYKESVIKVLDKINVEAKIVGAVNTIEIKDNILIGHNTDIIGFEESIKPLLREKNKAIILGNGGSAKAVKYVLEKLNIKYKNVSRNSIFDYPNITENIIKYYDLIINTTPLGMYPHQNRYPNIPFQYLTSKHTLFDLIYNPEETLFLKYGKEKKCKIQNGLKMLKTQADSSWKIWNS